MSRKVKARLDQLLVEKGMAESREKARALIMAGLVRVDGRVEDKPGKHLPLGVSIELKATPRYVSRGGTKLEAALKHFQLDVRGLTLLDIGASTGGFTDCLLKHGAQKVIAIDVGYGQLHWRLRQDPRVVVLERVNARHLEPEQIDCEVHGAVVDVSFISLKLILPPLSRILSANTFLVALVKPQFEVGKGQVGKGGVVRDPGARERVVSDIAAFSRALGWKVMGHIESPIPGPKGNQEYFMYLRK